MSKSARLVWTTMGLTVVAFDVAVAMLVAPVAVHAVRARSPQVIVSAARHAAQRALAVVGRQAGRMAGDGLTRIARGASRLYETMLRVTPASAATTEPVDRSHCRHGLAPDASSSEDSKCSGAGRTNADATPRPARYYSQTL